MNAHISRQFERSSLEAVERIVTHRGVTFQGLSYASPLLNTLHQINRAPERAVIHFDRNDLSHMYVFEAQSPGFAAIPCGNFRYAKSLSLTEHRAVLAYCRRRALRTDEDTLLQILWIIRSGKSLSDTVGCRSKSAPDKRKPHRRGKGYHIALMSKLGTAVQNFEKDANNV